MATTLPRPSRASNGPPNMALPALPVSKSRKSTGSMLAPPQSPGSPGPGLPRPSNATTPRSSLRAPSMNVPPTPAPTTALPQPKGLPTPVNGAGKTLRKSVSINSFPHPPRGDQRSSSLPPSPLANGDKTPRPARKSKLPKELASQSTYAPTTPSLLNGSGEGKSIRMSDGLISVGSPTQSRSSSAQDSYSTSATTYDEPMDGSQNPKADAVASASTSTDSEKRSSKEAKGNVVVSVRVRPDTSGKEQNPEGEWMVDGRKSLISYRGKEGGDHTYGAFHPGFPHAFGYFTLQTNHCPQTMYSLPTITIPEYMTTSPSVLCDASWRATMELYLPTA